MRLLTQAEGLDQRTIAVDVFVVEILQQLAATAYELGQRAGRGKVLVVLLEVLGEVLDAIGEQRYLALARACVGGRLAILGEDLLLLCFVEIHNVKDVIIGLGAQIHLSDACPANHGRGVTSSDASDFPKSGCKGTQIK